MEPLGYVIKNARKQLGLTQGELGEKVNRPQSSIARLEVGTLGDTHFSFIMDLAAALEMPPEVLVAKALGREIVPWTENPTKSQAFEALKGAIEASDPRTKRMIHDVLSKLTAWVEEEPKEK